MERLRTLKEVRAMHRKRHRKARAAELTERWRKLVERDGPHCDLCGVGYPVEFDHVAPGGSDDLSNLCLAHEFCNKMKGTSNHDQARQVISGWRKRAVLDERDWPPPPYRWREYQPVS